MRESDPQAGGFVGRARQLAQLRSCAAGVREGVSWIAVVEGEAGIGKTALVHHFISGLDDFDVLWASCDPSEQDLAFGVVEQIVRRLPAVAVAGSALENGIRADLSAPEAGADLLRALSANRAGRPVVVVVDDAQWSDSQSTAVLSYLGRRLWSQPILVLLTTRSDSGTYHSGDEPWWQRLSASTEHSLRIPLTGMDEPETLEMVRAVGLGPLGATAVRRLVTCTGGHPLHLRSLLAEVPTGALADPHRPLAAPPSLASATWHAVDRLAPESRALVEALAVLGRTVPLALAAQVADLSSPVNALEQALRADLVQWQPQNPSTLVGIKHALQREAIYRMVPPSRLRDLHAAAALVVDADAAWAHRVAARDHSDAKLAADLHAEADRLASAGQLSRSATLLLWASDLSTVQRDREDRLLRAAIRLLLARDYTRCLALADAVHSCAPSATRSCVLGGLAYARADYEEAHWRLAGLPESAAAQDAHVAELACLWLGAALTRQHRSEDALPLLLCAAGLDLPQPRAVNYARHLLTLASGSLTATEPGPHSGDGGEATARTALAAGLLLDPRGIVRLMAQELHAGMHDLKTLVRRQRVGEVMDVHVTEYFTLAAFQYLSGVWDDAAVTARHALTLAAANGELFAFAAGHATASMAASGEGRWDIAREQLRASEEAARRTQAPLDQVYPVLARSVLGQASGDPYLMHQALSHLPAPGGGWLGWWLPLQVEASTGTGRLDEAAEALGHLEALAEEVPGLKVTSCWLTGDLALANGDLRAAETAYLAGLALPRGRDEIPLHRARLEHSYARFLLLSDPQTARRHFEGARQAYLALGATPYADRITTETADSTEEPLHRNEPDPGPLTNLTERERAVAQLVSEGMTNREVSQSLYVSVKTVEYHLGHVFEKLGITSRRQLRSALTSAAPDDG